MLREPVGGLPVPRGRPEAPGLPGEAPGTKVISLGVGNTTEPLSPRIAEGLRLGAERLATREGYSGYGDEQGMPELRAKIAAKALPLRDQADGGLRVRRGQMRHRQAPGDVRLGRLDRRAGPGLSRVRGRQRHRRRGRGRCSRQSRFAQGRGLLGDRLSSLLSRERLLPRPGRGPRRRPPLLLLAEQPDGGLRHARPARGASSPSRGDAAAIVIYDAAYAGVHLRPRPAQARSSRSRARARSRSR